MPKKSGSISIPKPNIQTMRLTVVGDTPLIVHKFSDKAANEMLEKQMGKAKRKKSERDPYAEFREALYLVDDGDGGEIYGFKSNAFKLAAVNACRLVDGLPMTKARIAFHVLGEYGAGEFVKIEGSEPRMREDIVRLESGTSYVRFRPEFFPWWTELIIKFHKDVVSDEQLVNLINHAGSVGVGDWRPEKNGNMGMFRVADADDMKKIEQWRKKNAA